MKGAQDLLSVIRRRNHSLPSGNRSNQHGIVTGRTTFPKKPAKAPAGRSLLHEVLGVRGTEFELSMLWVARCPKPRERPGSRSSVTMLTGSV